MIFQVILKINCVSGFDDSSRYSDSETESRSPSPSSGVETNSFKDSPMQMDVMGLDQGFGTLPFILSLTRSINQSLLFSTILFS